MLPQANRLFAPPAASAAERSKTIFCRFHAVILTTGAKKKNPISRLFPVCRPLTTGTEKKSLFSRLPPPGVLYHRREKINLDFSASPSGHPSRRHAKAKLVFPGFRLCWPLRLPLAIFFPALPSLCLSYKPAQATIFYHKPTACLPSPAFPRTKKGLPPTFSPRSSFPPLPPLFAFSTISKRFYALPFPRSGLFLFPFFRSSLPFRKL